MGERIVAPKDALLNEHFAHAIGLSRREPTPSNQPTGYSKNTKETPPNFGQAFDSADEAATKRAVEEGFLAGVPSQPDIKLPVQYENATAEKLYQLFIKATIDGDAQQGICSKLYQAPHSDKVIFCRDKRGYDESKVVDPCYDYARYGINLFLSWHLLLQAYGINDTDFIAENAQRFYQQFMVDIQDYRQQLSARLSEAEKSVAVRKYAQTYLSNTVHGIAQQLTARLGKKHKEFKNIEESLASLDMVVVSASMAFQAIPYVIVENFGYHDDKQAETANVNKELASIIYPKPAKATAEIKELYEGLQISRQEDYRFEEDFADDVEEKITSLSNEEYRFADSVIEKKPQPLSDTENEERLSAGFVAEKPQPLSDTEDEYFLADDDGRIQLSIHEATEEYNFLDKLKPAKKRLMYYFKEAMLEGKVTLCSQDRGNLVGNKNGRAVGTYTVNREEGRIELVCDGYFVANSTSLAAFRNISREELVHYTRISLSQLHETLARGADNDPAVKKRGHRLCLIALCGIDIKTTFDNRHRAEAAKIDAIDAKILDITAAAAKEVEQTSTGNFAINYENLGMLINGNDIPSKLAQKALAAITGYNNLEQMLPYVRHVAGIEDNVAYIQAFRDAFKGKLSSHDAYRLEQYLQLMEKALAASASRNPLSSSETFLDTLAVFNLLANVYNELIIKYDHQKNCDFILPPINCASGENRTGIALFHCMVLARLAAIVGPKHISELLHPKYYELRRIIGDELARGDMLGKDNGNCGNTAGTDSFRDKNKGSISPNDVHAEVRDSNMCRPGANFKNVLQKGSSKEGEFVYIEDKERVDILHDGRIEAIARNTALNAAARKKAYQDLIATFSSQTIGYTLQSPRDPAALSWLPAEEFTFIHEVLLDNISAKEGIRIYDNLGFHPGLTPCRQAPLPWSTAGSHHVAAEANKIAAATATKPATTNKSPGFIGKAIGVLKGTGKEAVGALKNTVDLKIGAGLGAIAAAVSVVLVAVLGHEVGILLLSTLMGAGAFYGGNKVYAHEVKSKLQKHSLGWDTNEAMGNSKFGCGFFSNHFNHPKLVVQEEIPQVRPTPAA